MRSLRNHFFTLVILGMSLPQVTGEELVSVDLSSGKWDRNAWTNAKSAHYSRQGKWIQEPDHIRNDVPADATPAEMLGKRAAETHACLFCKRRFTGDINIMAEVSFDHRMAPAIVLAPKLISLKNDHNEYQSHIQIVLFDQGINVWHGDWSEGKFTWTKIGYARFGLVAKKKYLLSMTKKGKSIEVRVNDKHVFGFVNDVAPESFFAGIIGCEGVNRFYSFRVVK